MQKVDKLKRQGKKTFTLSATKSDKIDRSRYRFSTTMAATPNTKPSFCQCDSFSL